jgi:rod shape-determining protein MreC
VRNIFLFIRRYSNLVVFLFLQVLCIYFIVSYNKYHQAAFGNTINKFTGSINKQYNKVEYYFQLSRTNDSLVKANEVLYNKLRSNFNLPDSSSRTTIDTIRIDSIISYKRITYLGAKVISNSISSQSNYIVITGPNVKYFTKSMGVVDVNNNIVGKITEVNGDYAVVMSLLNKDSKVNGKLYKNEENSGIVSWNGESTNILSFSNIPKSAVVKVGDSVVTNISSYFPKGLLIGKVTSVKPEKVNNNFNILLKSAVNFNSIEYVYVVENKDAEATKNILEKVKLDNK